MRYKLYIFDLDGTLVDAYTAIWKSLNYTRKALGYPPVSYGTAKKNIGKGDLLFIEAFFPELSVQEALSIYRCHHKGSLKRYCRLRPGASAVLGFLRKKGIKTAIASNRPRCFTEIIVRKLRLKDRIDFLLCADEIKSLKPDPKILNLIIKKFKVKKDETVFAGDMDIDMETAKRAGVDAIFVKGGSSGLNAVRKYRNIKIVSCLREIVSEKRNWSPAYIG
ncbi:MAG: HAD family hydrolase [Candidatus Omnitrophica bacterium]|nr:HAD family hydrolase [Candidatus Omnitrophota bacterium]